MGGGEHNLFDLIRYGEVLRTIRGGREGVLLGHYCQACSHEADDYVACIGLFRVASE